MNDEKLEMQKKLKINDLEYSIATVIHQASMRDNKGLTKKQIANQLKTEDIEEINSSIESLMQKEIIYASSGPKMHIDGKWVNTLSVIKLENDSFNTAAAEDFLWVGKKEKEEKERAKIFRLLVTDQKRYSFYFGESIIKQLRLRLGQKMDIGYDSKNRILAFRKSGDYGYKLQEQKNFLYFSISYSKLSLPISSNIELDNKSERVKIANNIIFVSL